jgi:hypothetical protein
MSEVEEIVHEHGDTNPNEHGSHDDGSNGSQKRSRDFIEEEDDDELNKKIR